MSPKCWYNVGNNIISQRSHNIQTTLCECWCAFWTHDDQDDHVQHWVLRWYNIYTTLPEGCLDICPQQRGVTLSQHLQKVAWTFSQCQSPTLGNDIATALSQHCLNVVLMLVPNVGERHQDNIGTTLL